MGTSMGFSTQQGKIKADVEYSTGLFEGGSKAPRRLLEGQNIKPFVDVLYSTVELLATAQLLIVPDPKYTKKQTHASTQIKYSGFTKLGNFKPEYATTLNKLSGLRDQARYLKGDLYISEGDCRKYLEIVEDMLKYTEKIIT